MDRDAYHQRQRSVSQHPLLDFRTDDVYKLLRRNPYPADDIVDHEPSSTSPFLFSTDAQGYKDSTDEIRFKTMHILLGTASR